MKREKRETTREREREERERRAGRKGEVYGCVCVDACQVQTSSVQTPKSVNIARPKSPK